MIRPRRVFVDLDGVLVDWMGGVRRIFPELPTDEAWPAGRYDVAAVLGINRNAFWRIIAAEGEDWWANLDPYPWAGELLERAAEVGPVTIATSLAPCLDSHAGKALWLQLYFGTPGAIGLYGCRFRDYVLVGCGKEVLARPGDLLIDDSDREISAWRRADGLSLHLPRPWNALHAQSREPMAELSKILKLLSDPFGAGDPEEDP